MMGVVNFIFIACLTAYPLYLIIKWGLLYLHYGKEEEPIEVNLAGKLHEPPSDLKPYFVDTLLNDTLSPTGRSVSSALLYLVKQKWLKISYQDRFDVLGNRKREYFLELDLERGKEFEGLPLLEQKLITFIFHGVGNKASFEKIKSFHAKEPDITKSFWRDWKALILSRMVKNGLIDMDSYYMERYLESELVLLFGVIVFSILTGIDNDIRQILEGHLTFIYIFFIIMLSAVVILKIFKLFILKRSVMGNVEYSKWRAFKRWMEDYSVTKNYPIDSLILWQNYLMYGLAIGVSKKALSELPIKYDLTDEVVDSGLNFFPVEEISASIARQNIVSEFIEKLIEFTSFVPEMFGKE